MGVQSRRSSRMFITLGAVLTLLAMGGVYFIAHSATKSTKLSTQPVLVATHLIPAHTTFARSQDLANYFTVVQFPLKAVPLGSFRSTNDFARTMLSAGNRANTVPMYASEPVVDSMFTDLGKRPAYTLAFDLPPNDVAMSFQVSAVDGVAGGVQPGDSVDVIASWLAVTANNNSGEHHGAPTQTQYVYQNVKVLDIGPIAPPSPNGASTSASSSSSSSSSAGAGGSVLLTVQLNHQQALVLQHLKDFAASWHISIALQSAHTHQTFSTTPVQANWMWQKLANDFVDSAL